MTGSLQIKNDKYYAVLNIYDNKGKRKQKWIATELPAKGNKKRAEQFLREQLREHEAREKLVYSDMLFADAVRQWLEGARLQVDAVTWQGYETLAKRHILPYFDESEVKLVDINRRMLQAYFEGKSQNGRIDGKGGLSPRTIRLHKNIIFQTLTEAVRDNLIPANPCEYVTLPQNVRFEAKFLSVEQVQTLLQSAKDDPLYPLLWLTSVYGLRRSEVLGLQWDSVDFAAKTLTIKHTVVKVTETVAKDKTKSASSYRSFPLLPEAEGQLLKLKETETANRKLFGKAYTDSEYILKWDNGAPFLPGYVSHHFKKLLKRAGLPDVRFHELRHSCASMLINNGFGLKDVQEWLGHADINMTANIYSHIDVSRKQKMADMLTGSLSGGGC